MLGIGAVSADQAHQDNSMVADTHIGSCLKPRLHDRFAVSRSMIHRFDNLRKQFYDKKQFTIQDSECHSSLRSE
jgi:hypothetical protein